MRSLRLAASRIFSNIPFFSNIRFFYRKLFDKNFIFRSSLDMTYSAEDNSIWNNSRFLFYEQCRLDSLSKRTKLQSDNILSFFLNTIISAESTKRYEVLDWGGGTGSSWFRVYKSLHCSKSFSWTVCDNSNLAKLGKKYSLVNDIPINFSENYISLKVDILYICSALQYVSFQKILHSLLSKRPKYLFFEGLLASPLGSFTVSQSLHGSQISCHFVSLDEFINFVVSSGYYLIYSSVNLNASHMLRTNFRYPRSLARFASSHLSYDLIFLLP